MTISYKVVFFFTLFLASAIAINSQWGKREKKDDMIFSTRVFNNSIRGAIIRRDLTFPQVVSIKGFYLNYSRSINTLFSRLPANQRRSLISRLTITSETLPVDMLRSLQEDPSLST